MPIKAFRVVAVLLFASLVATDGFLSAQAQDDPAIAHAKRIVDVLQREQFDDVVKEFSPQMAAAISVAQLRDVWTTLKAQFGGFKSFLDQERATPAPGMTTVTLGCQFEKTALNAVIAFDAQDKLAGFRFVPRPGSQ